MKIIVDRFEGNYAVCENISDDDLISEMLNIERSKLPLAVKEGDVLVITSDSIIIDTKETAKRKKEIELLTKDLWQ